MDDDKYWLAKNFKEKLKPEEKRKARIQKLKNSVKAEGLALRLKQLRELKEEMKYDAAEYYDEQWEPLVEGILKPLAKRIKERIKKKTAEYQIRLGLLAQEAKLKMLAFARGINNGREGNGDGDGTQHKPSLEPGSEGPPPIWGQGREEGEGDGEGDWERGGGTGLGEGWSVDEAEYSRRESVRASYLDRVNVPALTPQGYREEIEIFDAYEQLSLVVTRRAYRAHRIQQSLEERENWFMSREEEFTRSMNALQLDAQSLLEQQRQEEEGGGLAVEEEDGGGLGSGRRSSFAEAHINAAVEELSEELKEMQAKMSAANVEKDAKRRFRRSKRHRSRVYEPELVSLLNKMCIAVELANEFGDPIEEVMEEVQSDYDDEVGEAETDSEAEEEAANERERRAQDEKAARLAKEEEEASLARKAMRDAAAAAADEDPLIGCEITFMIFIGEEQKVEGLEELEAEDIGVMLMQQFDDPRSTLRTGPIGSLCLDVNYKLPYKKKLMPSWEAFWVHIIHPCFFTYSSTKSKPKKERADPEGRLASGLIMHNPTSEFSERSKETFLMFQRKYTKKPREAKKSDDPEAAARAAKAAAAAAEKKSKVVSVVNLNVDEFADDVKKLQLVRPDMDNLTPKEVERLRRIAEGFREHYETEMRKGLVDGARLHTDQYKALKDRDTAARIYRNAKGKLAQSNRKIGIGVEDPLPKMSVSVITDEQFGEWVFELRQEEADNLKAVMTKKAAMRELRQQESELRRRFDKQRHWIITRLASIQTEEGVGACFHKEIAIETELKMKAKTGDLDDRELARYEHKKNEFSAKTISEEKETRKLFDMIVLWAWRREKINIRSLKRKARGYRSGRRGAEHAAAMEQSLEGVVVQSASHFEHSDSDKSGDENSSDDDDLNEEAGDVGAMFTDVLPSISKQTVTDFVEVVREYRKAEDEVLASLAKSSLMVAQNNARIRRENAMKHARLEAEKYSGKRDEEAHAKPFEDEAPLPTVESLGIQTDFKKLVGRERTLLPHEYELAKSIRWIKLAHKDKMWLDCLENLPTVVPGFFARDELIQFATILCELEPLLLRAVKTLEKLREEEALAAGLRVKKFGKKGDGGGEGDEAGEGGEGGGEDAKPLTRKEQKEKERAEKHAQKMKTMPMTDEMRAAHAARAEEAARMAGLGDEAIRRMKRAEDALRRQAQREKAWLMAHPHRYENSNKCCQSPPPHPPPPH